MTVHHLQSPKTERLYLSLEEVLGGVKEVVTMTKSSSSASVVE
jgi:hypothetical protein